MPREDSVLFYGLQLITVMQVSLAKPGADFIVQAWTLHQMCLKHNTKLMLWVNMLLSIFYHKTLQMISRFVDTCFSCYLRAATNQEICPRTGKIHSCSVIIFITL